MRHICTLSDINYLIKGLTLYRSILENNKSFTLHYLCLDDESYDLLTSLNLDKIIPYSLSDLLKKDSELLSVRNTLRYDEFCWSMASYFCKELLKTNKSILYCDSDLYFYRSFDDIYGEVGDKSIGLIRHRHIHYGHRVGEFNVGIIYFRGDTPGISCSSFWWDLVKTKHHKYYNEYGTCGDQKYLELFTQKYLDNVCIIDTIVGHGAPFNFHLYDYSKFTKNNKTILYNDREQGLSFVHFMKFKPSISNATYSPTDEPDNQKFMGIKEVKLIYDEYDYETHKTYSKYF